MLAGLRDLLAPCPNCEAHKSTISSYKSKLTHGHSRSYSRKTHYDILGVRGDASSEQIKTAFVEQSKQLHPDKNSEGTGSHEKFVRLNEAYMTLSKPILRREYDFTLAARIYQQQNIQSKVYHSHSPGNSPRPGSGFHNVEADEKIFWDETLWHMRDKSKDKYYEGKPYYGVKGIKKLPNTYIVLACIGLISSGVLLHLFALSHSRRMNQSILDERDKENNKILKASQDRAKLHGNALQLELLKSQLHVSRNPASK